MRTLLVLAGLAFAAPLAAQTATGLIQPGDRVLLRVAGEPTLSDTFTVAEGPAIDLPTLGKISLEGVRRDSIEPHLKVQLARYLRDPVVRAQVLLRLGILGEVTRPGFYALPSGSVLGDLIMVAGGMTRDARFGKSKLRRDNDVLLSGSAVERAVASGQTLDALALRSGDALEVPRRPDQESRVRILTALLAVPVAIFAITRL